jgi:anti-anti-sigma factor
MVHIDTDTTTNPDAVQLQVAGQLDLEAVAALGEALGRAARMGKPVEIHLGGVDFIDGCGLSVLMKAARTSRCAGHELAIVDPSRCVRRLIDLTGTADRLPPLRPAEAIGTDAVEGAPAPAVEGAPTPAFRR